MQNFIKTIINAVQLWTDNKIKKSKKQLDDRISNSTADWNQNDSNADNYVKNRPFYEENEQVIWVDEQTVMLDENGCAELTNNGESPPVNAQYTVIFDGIVYSGIVWEDSDVCTRTDFITSDGVDVYIFDGRWLNSFSKLSGEHTICISYVKHTIHQIDDKYINHKVLSVNGKTGNVRLTASDLNAPTYTQVNNKMDKNNPSGTGSFSMNRKQGSTIGSYSSAVGYQTIASGSYQHVQGKYNIDSSKYLHIVGNGSSENSRSNAHTLDGNGVGWYKGGLQVGGKAQDDGAKKVLLDGEAIDLKTYQGSLPNFSKGWSQLVYGNGKFVTIKDYEQYQSREVYSSEDGVNWIKSYMPVSGEHWNLHYCGGKFFAGCGAGSFYSEDGVTWTKTDYINLSAYMSYGNGKFLSKSNLQDGVVCYSEDGVNWNNVSTPYTTIWGGLVYGDGKFVAISKQSNEAYYSEDGITWNQAYTLYNNDGVSYNWDKLVYGDGKFVAISNTKKRMALYSNDGIVWEQTTIPIGHSSTAVYSCGKFIVTESIRIAGSGTNVICYSEDGVNWKTATMPRVGCWMTLVCGNNKLVAIDYNNFNPNFGVDTNAAAYSTDGVNWTEVTLPLVGRWDKIAYGNGKFVAIACNGFNSFPYYSEDGINWYNCYSELCHGDENVTDIVSNLIINKRAIPVPETATVGQTIVVKSVDENGKPTEWECAEITIPDSGQNSDWNQNDETAADYIKNRTHWEENNQTVIEWDGDSEGLEQWDFTISGIMLHKVSDATPTLDELYGCLLGAQLGDNYMEMELVGQDYNDVVDLNNEINPVNCKFVGRFFIVYDTDINFSGQAFTLTSTGIWATPDFRKLVYGTNTVHPLDEKFIPDTIARKSDIVPGGSGGVSSWNDLLDKPSTLPNPNSLTLTGAVNASYDGSEEVVVEIPVVEVPVTSVNGMTGDVTIDIPTSSVTSVNGMTGDVQIDIPEPTGSSFVVTLTVTSWTEQIDSDGLLTGVFASKPNCSHTFQEIDDAYKAGKTIIFDLIESGDDDTHTYLSLTGKTKMNGETTYQFGIDFGNSIMNGYFSRYATRPTVSRKVYMDKITVDSASVGQTIVVKSVNYKGVPTAWEAVDLPSGSGGVQSNWNQNDETAADYVKNRTHYEENTRTVIEWDGNTDGLESIPMGDGFELHKISDLTPSKEDFYGTVQTGPDGKGAEISESGEGMTQLADGFLQAGFLYVVTASEVTFNGVTLNFPSHGIYTLNYNGEAQFSYTEIGSLTIHQIDEKFIPDTIARKSDIQAGGGSATIPDWDQNDATQLDYINNRTHYKYHNSRGCVFSGAYEDIIYRDGTYRISDILIDGDPILGEQYSVYIDGAETRYASYVLKEYASGIWYLGNLSMLAPSADNTGEKFLILISNDPRMNGRLRASIYASVAIGYNGHHDHNAYVYGPITDHSPLDERYIPDSIARVDAPMNSVTLISPNGTKFSVMIDDSGKLIVSNMAGDIIEQSSSSLPDSEEAEF